MTFNADYFRQQFPAITDDLIYLDTAATALKPYAMIQATKQYYAHNSSTANRSHHQAAQIVTSAIQQARQHVATHLNASSAKQIIWTAGATEAANLIAQSYARPRLKPNDEIIVTEIEHHSNILPWLMVTQQTGANLVKLPINPTTMLPNITLLSRYLTPRTKILAISQMSNVTGGIPALSDAIKLAHQNNTVVAVDGAQGIVHLPTDLTGLDADFYFFSAHKLYGPTGVGVLYAKTQYLEEMSPWLGGGKMLKRISFTDFEPENFPACFEAGTPNIAGIIGFSATLKWLEQIDQQAAEQYTLNLAQLAEHQLADLPGFISYRAANSPILAFNFQQHHHDDLAEFLANTKIALRHGQHCAQPLMAALGINGTLRASFAPYNNENDVQSFVTAVKKGLTFLE